MKIYIVERTNKAEKKQKKTGKNRVRKQRTAGRIMELNTVERAIKTETDTRTE